MMMESELVEGGTLSFIYDETERLGWSWFRLSSLGLLLTQGGEGRGGARAKLTF